MGIISDNLGPPLEWCLRQIYWRSKTLRDLRNWKDKRRKPKPVSAFLSESDLRDILKEIGVGTKSPVTLVHSSVNNWAIKNPNDTEPLTVFETAETTLNVLVALTKTNNATLAMPTHPYYKEVGGDLLTPVTGLTLKYDPEMTPCKVGLINEFFRRYPDVQRSLFPLSSVACLGPLSHKLLENNLRNENSLPHGEDSPYYRLCHENGLMVSIGLPLIQRMTILHTASELNESRHPEWLYRKRHFRITFPDGKEREQVVREQHPALSSRCTNRTMCRRDLLKAGILHEGNFNGMRIDWAYSNAVVDYILDVTKKNGGDYPRLLMSTCLPLSR